MSPQNSSNCIFCGYVYPYCFKSCCYPDLLYVFCQYSWPMLSEATVRAESPVIICCNKTVCLRASKVNEPVVCCLCNMSKVSVGSGRGRGSKGRGPAPAMGSAALSGEQRAHYHSHPPDLQHSPVFFFLPNFTPRFLATWNLIPTLT